MKQYNVRTEDMGNGFTCWIDIDGQPTINQPNAPHKLDQGYFTTEEEAIFWGNSHVESLQVMDQKAEEEMTKKAELEQVQLAAYQAQIDTANYLKAIVDSLPK